MRCILGGVTRIKAIPLPPAALPSPFSKSRFISMTTSTSDSNGQAQKTQNNGGKKEVKILMLHGYTQSGPLFRAKTRALEKVIAKTLAPFSLLPILIYPTAPNRLRASDIPGFQTTSGAAAADDDDEDDPANLPDTWAWFRKHEATGTYRFFDEGMGAVADAMREAGGDVDGVCGFSQGGFMSAAVAAAMETGRALPAEEGGSGGEWARKLREANGHRPLKFAVSYSGFYGPVDMMKWCYEPKIQTPTLHILGSLDAIVEESRSQGLIDRCQDPVVVVHPGGHHVPVSKEWVMPLAGFIKDHANDEIKTNL